MKNFTVIASFDNDESMFFRKVKKLKIRMKGDKEFEITQTCDDGFCIKAENDDYMCIPENKCTCPKATINNNYDFCEFFDAKNGECKYGEV